MMSSSAAMKAGEKASSFAMTCNLLSQYIKEKGRSLGDLGLAVAPRPIDSSIVKNDTYRPPTTMSLLPGVDVSEEDTKVNVSDRNVTKSMELFPQRSGFGPQNSPAADKREPDKSQLTIFYGGKVLVFDNFPADKANDLMMLVGKGCPVAKNTGFAPASSVPSAAVGEPKNLSSNLKPDAGFLPPPSKPQPAVQARPPRPIVSDLPIARKASLHRFLEKRKDRINAKAPYQMSQGKDSPASMVTPKIEENQPWLGLKPSLSSECSR